jgi:DNA end-binding protein Ku
MPPHAVAPGTISFGLVAIPVKLYTATTPGGVSFNLLHGTCGSRIRQQHFCPTCNATVERGELVRAYEFAKEQYVRVADDELKALEGEASRVIDIAEFVPLPRVDPVYFDKAYYLGPDKGGAAQIRPGELDLALKLIDGLSGEDFKPEQYRDEHRERVLELVGKKVAGQEITVAGAPPPRPQVIDLMEALAASLAKRPEKKPLAKARRPEAPAARRAQAGKK